MADEELKKENAKHEKNPKYLYNVRLGSKPCRNEFIMDEVSAIILLCKWIWGEIPSQKLVMNATIK